MRKLVTFIVLTGALAFPTTGLAHHAVGHWKWGFNYLGNSTSTGNGCLHSLGEVCSGWNYWFDHYTSKNGGGTTLPNFQISNDWRGIRTLSGAGTLYFKASDVGWGGRYIRAAETYMNGDPSYLYVDAWT